MTFEEWLAEANQYAIKHYCLDAVEMAGGDPDQLRDYFDEQADPRDVIEALAEKYGLVRWEDVSLDRGNPAVSPDQD